MKIIICKTKYAYHQIINYHCVCNIHECDDHQTSFHALVQQTLSSTHFSKHNIGSQHQSDWLKYKISVTFCLFNRRWANFDSRGSSDWHLHGLTSHSGPRSASHGAPPKPAIQLVESTVDCRCLRAFSSLCCLCP